MSKPLAGIRIVEFSTMITASLATMMMADQGAEVVKVEPKDIGDPMRHIGSQKAGISALFNSCNRGKRSLAIDLKSEVGRDAVFELCKRSDIVIHNYRPGVMDRLGLGSGALREINPRLVYIAITGFGHKGPLAHAPAYDHVMQGFAGITDVQGMDDGRAYVRQTICDKLTAYTAAQAASAALFARERNGEGQHIDLSMLDSALYFMWPDGMMHASLLADDVQQLPPFSNFYRLLETRDGHAAFIAALDEQWREIFALVGKPGLIDDPRFADLTSRSAHNAALMEEACGHPVDMTTEEVIARFSEFDIPCAPCTAVDDIPDLPQVRAMGSVIERSDPHLGKFRFAAPPPQFGGERLEAAGPSPALGEHGEEVLAELGYDKEMIERICVGDTQ